MLVVDSDAESAQGDVREGAYVILRRAVELQLSDLAPDEDVDTVRRTALARAVAAGRSAEAVKGPFDCLQRELQAQRQTLGALVSALDDTVLKDVEAVGDAVDSRSGTKHEAALAAVGGAKRPRGHG